jgi:hypothetical protein
MERKLPQDDKATAPFCPHFIIGDVLFTSQTMLGKVSGMGRKADPIGNFYFPKSKRRKEEWKSVSHS